LKRKDTKKKDTKKKWCGEEVFVEERDTKKKWWVKRYSENIVICVYCKKKIIIYNLFSFIFLKNNNKCII
jgi:hypothetical protein